MEGTKRNATGLLVAAMLLLVGTAVSTARAQDDKYQLPVKPGVWLVKHVMESDGKRSPDVRALDLPLKFHEEQFAKGFVHEDGGRFLMCRTKEQLNLINAIQQSKAPGCEVTIEEFTPKRIRSRSRCEQSKTTSEAVTTITDSENYALSVDAQSEFQGKPSQTKMVMASTWIGSDCKAILEERFAVVRESVQRKEAQDAAEKARLDREQAAAESARREQQSAGRDGTSGASDDTTVIVQGLLQGLQQYADAKRLRKGSQSQQRVAPMPTYTPPQQRQPIAITNTPPTIYNGSAQDERSVEGSTGTGSGSGNGAGSQCQSAGSGVEARRAYDRCTCNSFNPGKFVFEDRGGKGWVCLSLPGRRFYKGCSLEGGKLSCTQV